MIKDYYILITSLKGLSCIVKRHVQQSNIITYKYNYLQINPKQVVFSLEDFEYELL